MKLENLLALYLYQNKKLNLPGIGVFTAEDVVAVPEDNEKHPTTVQGIAFTNTNVLQPDDDFIDFIKTHTGKMRPLAISDLESYLMLSKQFLNIGKPFHIDGVGTLQKVNDGSLKFTPGDYVSTKLEIPGSEKNTAETRKKSVYGDDIREYNKSNNGSKKAILLLLAIATLLLAGWGGYYLFKKNTTPEYLENTEPSVDTSSYLIDPADTLVSSMMPDSLAQKIDNINAVPAGSYKYVVEATNNKARALKRFNELKSFNKSYQLETNDSILFKIYVIKASPATDTTRLKDSLNAWYYGGRQMKVAIEQ